MLEKTPKQPPFSKTAAPPPALRRAAAGAIGRPRALPPERLRPDQDPGLDSQLRSGRTAAVHACAATCTGSHGALKGGV